MLTGICTEHALSLWMSSCSRRDVEVLMFDPVIEVLILAAIALVVLARLYTTLGKGDDDQPARRPNAGIQPVPDQPRPSIDAAQAGNSRPIFVGPAAGGLEEIYEADNRFSEGEFMSGARSAYKIIVDAFGRGDRDTLGPMLDTDVYEAWDAAIEARDPDADAFSVLRFRKVEIDSASLTDGVARVLVRFESELGNGEIVRNAKEIWTFMRGVNSPDPNWILDDVEVAN